MTNHEILNGISAIRSALSAFAALRGDVQDPNALESELLWLLEGICAENPALTDPSASIRNENAADTAPIGTCTAMLPEIPGALALLAEKLPHRMDGSRLSVPVEADFSRGLAMVLKADRPEDAAGASVMAQYILLSLLDKNRSMNYRCGDFVMGGTFFSTVHGLISGFPNKSGGKVCTKPDEMDALLKELEAAAAQSIAALGGSYASVYDYNRSNAVKLPEYAVVLYLDNTGRSDEMLRRLHLLMSNRRKNGMSFILVGAGDLLGPIEELAEYFLCYTGKETTIGEKAALPFAPDAGVGISDDAAAALLQSLQEAATVDTLYEHCAELQTEYFAMDSTEALRIPFAVNEHRVVQYFEVGGKAPSHALLSGTTGSGKSVALHTLIMQIVRNYHPDDVEIWAIDYKAVEFNSYIRHRPPHFRVIGSDDSPEFSLSLLDMLYGEYKRREALFKETNVQNIAQYREKTGPRSLPRIVVFIDEFQLMTQAVQTYTGSKDYRTVLENLMKLVRAMGISFVLSSQTVAAGLSGLTDGAREQIGCRMCLKLNSDTEIRETLMVSGDEATELAVRAKNLRNGQSIYKRARWGKDPAPDGKAYEIRDCNIFYINDQLKDEMIDAAIAKAAGSCTPKDVIVVEGSGRIPVCEKVRHPLQRFLTEGYEPEEGVLEWYPAAPTTLADAFRLDLENMSGANILLVGSNADLRESVVIHSLCGFLIAPDTRIVASFLDEHYSFRARMIAALGNIVSNRLTVNVGVRQTLETISALRKIRPTPGRKTVYLWYGLDKLKNDIFQMHQDDEDANDGTAALAPAPAAQEQSLDDQIADLMAFLSDMDQEPAAQPIPTAGSLLSFEDCRTILRTAFEMGPENDQHHMVLFHNYKELKNSSLIDLASFENRVGTRMSAEDSYELFGSSGAIAKTDDNTVICYSGSGQPTPLRPYRMPDAAWFAQFGSALKQL